MTRELFEAADALLAFFDGEQPPMRAQVLLRLRLAVEAARPGPPLQHDRENPYYAARRLDDMLP